MNIGPINTSMPVATTDGGASVGKTQAANDNVGSGNSNIPNSPAAANPEEARKAGGAPDPIQQMSTSDFLTLHNSFQEESAMDKMLKIFEAILALRLLEETVENVNKSIEEQTEEDN